MNKLPEEYNLEQAFNDILFLGEMATGLIEQVNFLTYQVLDTKVKAIRVEDKVKRDLKYITYHKKEKQYKDKPF